MKTYLICFAAVCAAAGGTAVQTDWAEGPSSTGPETSWAGGFNQSDNISWLALTGQISLSSEPLSAGTIEDVDPDVPTSGLDCCDVDGDGDVDIAGASLVNGHVWWFENIGSGSWESHSLPGEYDGALGCSFFDVDGDGYTDLLGGTCEPDQVVVWYNNSGNGEFGEPVEISPSFPGVHCAVGCYADEDGFADVMAAGNECNEIAVWYGLGNDQWDKVVIASGFTGTQSVCPGDIDGDGDLDAVGAALSAAEFAWWENPGNRTDPWVKHLVADNMTSAHHTVAVDMNADGFTDIVGSVFGLGKIIWWENDGVSQTVWEAHTVAPGFNGVLTAIPGDFDGDNDLDLAGASWVLDRIMWYENLDGSGENWQNRVVKTGFNGAWPLTCGDFDGNGRVEIAAGADVLGGAGSHGVSILEFCGFSGTGWLESSVLDTEENPQWSSFEFDALVPAGCSLQFFWRSSGDPGDLGEWSEGYSDWSELSGLIHRYAQYRVEIQGSGELSSPVLTDVRLNWDPQGTGEENIDSRSLISPVTSPSTGFLSINVTGAPARAVDVILYTITGRVLRVYEDRYSGETIQVQGLCPGMYLIRAVAGEDSYLQRVSLIL